MAHQSSRITLYTLYQFLHCKDKMIQKKDRQTSTVINDNQQLTF
jgi:hypothetical protein